LCDGSQNRSKYVFDGNRTLVNDGGNSLHRTVTRVEPRQKRR
jgi:hypothetical protein